jgi:hypothetical protein
LVIEPLSFSPADIEPLNVASGMKQQVRVRNASTSAKFGQIHPAVRNVFAAGLRIFGRGIFAF